MVWGSNGEDESVAALSIHLSRQQHSSLSQYLPPSICVTLGNTHKIRSLFSVKNFFFFLIKTILLFSFPRSCVPVPIPILTCPGVSVLSTLFSTALGKTKMCQKQLILLFWLYYFANIVVSSAFLKMASAYSFFHFPVIFADTEHIWKLQHE